MGPLTRDYSAVNIRNRPRKWRPGVLAAGRGWRGGGWSIMLNFIAAVDALGMREPDGNPILF